MEVEGVQVLTELGLNQLEAEVYTLLLTREPMTGYGVAKLLGKPTANVYKAIEALARRGAVLVEEGENRLCQAVPADEFLRHFKRSFGEKTQKAAEMLGHLHSEVTPDERIYQLESSALVLERCRTMLEQSQQIAVLDVFPEPLQELLPTIYKVLQRGVQVFVQVYLPTEIEGAAVAIAYKGDRIVEYWQSQQLNLVVDAEELVLALLNHDLSQVHQAVWSKSLYLSSMLHAGMMREQVVHRLMAVQNNENALDVTREILAGQQFFYNSDVPGQRALLERFASPTLADKQ